jgi:hypothetical protein
MPALPASAASDYKKFVAEGDTCSASTLLASTHQRFSFFPFAKKRNLR